MDGVWQIFVALAAAMAMCPFAFFWGCLPCCQGGCDIDDGKPRTNPKNEGTWVPSGTWRGAGGVTWTFTANPGDDSGETWFFYGSPSTSKAGGGATTAEQRDWSNSCNWYSSKTASPSTTSGLPAAFDKRANRLPTQDSVVHIYTPVDTATVGLVTVKNAYFWGSCFLDDSAELTTTSAAYDSLHGTVFNDNSSNTSLGGLNGGATFNGTSSNLALAVVNDGATFNDNSTNANSTINDGATFNDSASNDGTFAVVNNGATFNDSSENVATVNGGATFNDSSINRFGQVYNGAIFNNSASNFGSAAAVYGGATFNNFSQNTGFAEVNDGATFNDSAQNLSNATVNGGATFNDSSQHLSTATVNGGATFNDAACSTLSIGFFFNTPCNRKFVAHPTDLPTCNGTAPDGCANSADTCGCG